jgi:hypothetical protein
MKENNYTPYSERWEKMLLRKTKAELIDILKNICKTKGWVSVDDFLPEEGQLVWLTNGEGFTTLGCWVWTDKEDGSWCWCDASNQLIYQDVDKIVADCEVDDLDVKYWYPVPEVKTDIK